MSSTSSSIETYPHIIQAKTSQQTNLIIEGTQIPITCLIEDYHRFNHSVDAVLSKWNHLNPSLIFSTLAYYYDHKLEMDHYIESLAEKAEEKTAVNLYPDIEIYDYMQKQGQLFDQQLPKLLNRYEGYYIYFENGQVLEADKDEEKLLDLVEQKYGLKPMFIEKVASRNDI
jgi:uncharacterized protein (DUF433 family)